jgi:hypothetical protein
MISYSNGLTPDEVAKMAAAGVKITWDDIQHRLENKMVKSPDPVEGSDEHLLEALHGRYFRGRVAGPGERFNYSEPKFSFIAAHKLNNEKVAVFVVRKGEPVTIIDDWALYPSDALLTQLRLLENT